MKLQNSSATFTDSRPRLETAFEEHRKELVRHARYRLGTDDAASDLVQEAFSRVLAVKNLEQIKNLRAYLFRIVTHLAVDYQRDLHRNHSFLDVEAPENEVRSVASIENEPAREFLDRERVALLVEAIKSLPTDTRKMFILFKLKGWQQQRIADHFQVSLSTVEKKIGRAIRHCRKRLEE